MKVGAPFSPYKVFQGVFAPYWLLVHRRISAGAKLCYVRLPGYATSFTLPNPLQYTASNAPGGYFDISVFYR